MNIANAQTNTYLHITYKTEHNKNSQQGKHTHKKKQEQHNDRKNTYEQ